MILKIKNLLTQNKFSTLICISFVSGVISYNISETCCSYAKLYYLNNPPPQSNKVKNELGTNNIKYDW